jgi:hypothetical protein
MSISVILFYFDMIGVKSHHKKNHAKKNTIVSLYIIIDCIKIYKVIIVIL